MLGVYIFVALGSFFSPFNYGNFMENLAREKFVSIFLTGGKKKEEK